MQKVLGFSINPKKSFLIGRNAGTEQIIRGYNNFCKDLREKGHLAHYVIVKEGTDTVLFKHIAVLKDNDSYFNRDFPDCSLLPENFFKENPPLDSIAMLLDGAKVVRMSEFLKFCLTFDIEELVVWR